jgi:hypothetical protein
VKWEGGFTKYSSHETSGGIQPFGGTSKITHFTSTPKGVLVIFKIGEGAMNVGVMLSERIKYVEIKKVHFHKGTGDGCNLPSLKHIPTSFLGLLMVIMGMEMVDMGRVIM